MYRPGRQASTGELLSPRHVHKPSKHKPASFFLLNPEVILRPDPLSPNSVFFPPPRISTNAIKLEGLCGFFFCCFFVFFLRGDSILHAFKANFYSNLPLFLILTYKATNTATKHNKRSCHRAKNQHQQAPTVRPLEFKGPGLNSNMSLDC